MKKIIIWSIILILIIILAFLSINIRPSISGQVVNAVTGEPISEIKVVRKLIFSRFSFEPASDVIRQKTYTDSNGNFYFSSKIVPTFLILRGYKREILSINYEYDVLAFPTGSCSNGVDSNYNILNFPTEYDNKRVLVKENKYQIKLSPVVYTLSDCNGVDTCIEDNALIIALKSNDESICMDYKGELCGNLIDGNRLRYACASIFIMKKNDISICESLNSEDEEDCKSFYSFHKNMNYVEFCDFQPWSNLYRKLCKEYFET